ncbi:hypothetical protein OUZ56_029506 [Daphnia magna]|uniref:Uncharacterized protein n=1 Tax=Daphnia magna TaxID=35525 RepID=A0ABR0B714_9CRUS|nr:hypothetical protein OUZ56_029506 [Daphnia magna]
MNEENFNCVGCADETIEAAMKIALVITQSKLFVVVVVVSLVFSDSIERLMFIKGKTNEKGVKCVRRIARPQ